MKMMTITMFSRLLVFLKSKPWPQIQPKTRPYGGKQTSAKKNCTAATVRKGTSCATLSIPYQHAGRRPPSRAQRNTRLRSARPLDGLVTLHLAHFRRHIVLTPLKRSPLCCRKNHPSIVPISLRFDEDRNAQLLPS